MQNDPGNKAAGRIVESYPENFTDQQVKILFLFCSFTIHFRSCERVFLTWITYHFPGTQHSSRICVSVWPEFDEVSLIIFFNLEIGAKWFHSWFHFSDNITSYSFVLTNIDSKWRFGFCRHDPKLSKAMILITYLPWHDLFLKFLNVLAIIKKKDTKEFQAFLREVYNKKVPEQNEALELLYSNGASTFVFKRPPTLPSIPENVRKESPTSLTSLNLQYSS